jgi:hypothetical protein
VQVPPNAGETPCHGLEPCSDPRSEIIIHRN